MRVNHNEIKFVFIFDTDFFFLQALHYLQEHSTKEDESFNPSSKSALTTGIMA